MDGLKYVESTEKGPCESTMETKNRSRKTYKFIYSWTSLHFFPVVPETRSFADNITLKPQYFDNHQIKEFTSTVISITRLSLLVLSFRRAFTNITSITSSIIVEYHHYRPSPSPHVTHELLLYNIPRFLYYQSNFAGLGLSIFGRGRLLSSRDNYEKDQLLWGLVGWRSLLLLCRMYDNVVSSFYEIY